MPAIQTVYPRPLFNESNILDLDPPQGAGQSIKNHFFWADNKDVLQSWSITDKTQAIKLIYIDPPFMSQMHYHSLKEHSDIRAFQDKWQPEAYLDMLYPRLLLMKQVLAADGSIFVHVDWHVSHYVHMLLDEVFGPENFINEIVWCYSGGGNSRRHLQRKHDLIFWYGRSPAYTFHPQHRPYTQGTLARGLTAVKGEKYKLSREGALLQDWWTDINKILSPTAYENVKYPTQKPRQLLKRIINMASNPGDLVADFFAGSGTTAEVSNELGRSWILCDNSPLALQTTISRLAQADSPPFAIYAQSDPLSQALSETSSSAARLRMKNVTVQANGADRFWVSLGIDYYQPEVLPENWDPAQFAAFIEFWEIDPDYNDKVFTSQYQLFRSPKQKAKRLPLNILLSLPRKKTYKIAVKLYDIFARQHLQIMEFNPDHSQ
jgi:site-specific DNA-methyltransferase (adenine-specific)